MSNRPYTDTLNQLLGLTNDDEFNEGIEYIESFLKSNPKAYLFSKRFWDWWKDQQDVFAMNILGLNGIEPDEKILNPLAEEALKDAYQFFKLKFKAKPLYPSKELEKKIIKEHLLKPSKTEVS